MYLLSNVWNLNKATFLTVTLILRVNVWNFEQSYIYAYFVLTDMFDEIIDW